MKYKVGDRVLVIETITEVDEDSDYPYIIKSDDGQDEWVYREDEILAVVNPDGYRLEAEEEKRVYKFEIGDSVLDRSNKNWGIGTVLEIDTEDDYSPYKVEYVWPTGSAFSWERECELVFYTL
jgi:hypothetical protein